MSTNEMKKIIDNKLYNLDLKDRLIIIAGPTGVGKSSFALNLAEKINGVIINADSIQVYKGLEIISSQPSIIDKTKVSHFLYGFYHMEKNFSVGEWLSLVINIINSNKLNNRIPIVVGGTGLYLFALRNGLSPIPKIDEITKNNTNLLLERIGLEDFRKKVYEIDPVYSSKYNDKQRLLRAYNVYVATGKTLSYWHKIKPKPRINKNIYSIHLKTEKEKLYNFCDMRFDRFLENGALEEVKKIWERKIDRSLSATKSLGVKWLLKFYDGKISMKHAINLSKRDTRRYIKRQNTWFKHNFISDLTIEI